MARTFGRRAEDVRPRLDDLARTSGRASDALGQLVLEVRPATLGERLSSVAASNGVDEDVVRGCRPGALIGSLPDGSGLAIEVAELLARPGDPSQLDLVKVLAAQLGRWPLDF